MDNNSDFLKKKYQKKSDKQHVLDNPDTYIGSIENIVNNSYIYDNNSNRIIQKNIEFIPGLYKLFDEAIVNSRDHVVRMNNSNEFNDNGIKNYNVTNINISIDDDIISVHNDGNGIDVCIHPEYKNLCNQPDMEEFPFVHNLQLQTQHLHLLVTLEPILL